MITDDFLRSAPLDDRLGHDLDHAAEILPLTATRSDDGPTRAIKDPHTVEPLPVNLDQLAQVDKPDLLGRRRLLGAFCRGWKTGLPLRVGMGLLVQSDHLPDGRVAIAVAQRV